MKKLFISFSMLFCAATMSFASESYKVNSEAVDAVISNAQEISINESSLELNMLQPTSTNAVLADKSMGGYLLRSFFCGFIGLHRSYMGTNGKSVWWWYFCVPVAGGVTNCVDFWGVVFMGQKQLDKYSNKGDLVVWW